MNAPKAPALPKIGGPDPRMGAFANRARQQAAYARPGQREVSRQARGHAVGALMPMRMPGASGFGGPQGQVPGAGARPSLPPEYLAALLRALGYR